MNGKLIIMSLTAVFCLTFAVSAATVYVDDDFEGYADQSAHDAVWTTVAGTQPTWSTDQSVSPTHSSYEPAGSPGRVTHAPSVDATNSMNGTDAEPLVLSYDIYINPNDLTSSRRYVELRQEDGSAGNIFVIGLTNLGGIDNTHFGIRNSFTWTELDALRQAGWNHVEASFRTSEVDITINGGATETFTRSVTSGYGRLYLGSGYSNNTVSPNDGFTYIDNVSLVQVPEPSAFVLLGLGLVAVLASRRK